MLYVTKDEQIDYDNSQESQNKQHASMCVRVSQHMCVCVCVCE